MSANGVCRRPAQVLVARAARVICPSSRTAVGSGALGPPCQGPCLCPGAGGGTAPEVAAYARPPPADFRCDKFVAVNIGQDFTLKWQVACGERLDSASDRIGGKPQPHLVTQPVDRFTALEIQHLHL